MSPNEINGYVSGQLVVNILDLLSDISQIIISIPLTKHYAVDQFERNKTGVSRVREKRCIPIFDEETRG
jgi:hypothetical protein